jgi:predicted metal-dependent hydrolase
LHLEINPAITKPDINIRQGKLWIDTPAEDNDLLRCALETWYRNQARGKINERIAYYQDKIGRAPGRVFIKDQKRRWGSCSARGNLNFNWRMVMAPEKVLDYVVVHELCHLIELNHSKAFWDALASILPDYKEQEEWLKNYGYRMKLYEKPV